MRGATIHEHDVLFSVLKISLYHLVSVKSCKPCFSCADVASHVLSSEPSAASRGRAAHARWPTSALAVGRDPLGALMAPMVATVASAAMVVSAVLAASGSGER